MKTILILFSTCLLGFVNASYSRFEAKHEQIPAEEQQNVKDKTNVRRDTVNTVSADSTAR